ncbi:hypothetical protein [Methylobacterium gossipiicola]|uniref:Uncharacterized protein n=1 Tax=Methylobacterium gossipiicola TaxID=582675 RepID=A0A1I2XMT8_9HYPH|nr:hypothetical protein [Methylobacterium gossipiicola]SFH14349.1 hypothetical protein SAMN05192565_1505 [Methylobacterium gossipiicola]
MLSYFLSTISVRVRKAKLDLPVNDPKLIVVADIESGLADLERRISAGPKESEDAYWTAAYKLERLLALSEPAESLYSELKRRVAEASDENLPAAPRLAGLAEAAGLLALDGQQQPPTLRPGGEAILRPLLLDTLEELHWAFQRKFYSRPIRRSATSRIVWIGLFALFLFILPYVLIYVHAARGEIDRIANWSGLPLYACMTSGIFGALFSRLLYLQMNWNALSIGGLKDAREFTSILLRACVGMTGAVVVSFFLQSNVIGGGLFPEFREIGLEHAVYEAKNRDGTPGLLKLMLIYPSKALALLVVWSFLAGFSERLVPSLLQDTESKVKTAPATI